jgi:chemotaxis protein CheC
MIREQSLAILQEIINIGVGKGAQVLNTLLSHHVSLDVPEVTETTSEGLLAALGFDAEAPLACVQMGYRGSLQGEVQLLFPEDAAAQMVSLIVGEGQAPDELDFIRQATLTEVGNIVINAVVGTLSNLFGFHLQYTLPVYRGGTLGSIEDRSALGIVEIVLLAKTRFTIEDLSLTGNMVLFFSLPTYRTLEDALERYAFG